MGGSLGGLTAALVLREHGCEVDVFERSAAPLEDRGAGIVLHPATIRYLTEVRARSPAELGVPARTLRYLPADGGEPVQRPCRFRFTTYRALYRELLAYFPAERYHAGAEVTGFEVEPGAVAVRLADGRTEDAALLVCADGAGSAARRRLLPEVEAAYAGYVGWRGAVTETELGDAFAALHEAITYCVMPDGHVLVYPIPSLGDGERALNWLWYRNVAAGAPLDALLTDRDGHRRSISVPPGHVQDAHRRELLAAAGASLPGPLADIVHATAEPFVQAVHDVEVPRMAFGRACLIGDAAFVLRPHVAAGTAKAADDGWHLGEALGAAGRDVPAALERWEPGRLRTGRIALARTREAGERLQFTNRWPVGAELAFGLLEQGDSRLD